MFFYGNEVFYGGGNEAEYGDGEVDKETISEYGIVPIITNYNVKILED